MEPIPEEKPLYNQSVLDIFIGIKDTWFSILDEILAGQFDTDTLTQGNRLFYIGLTLIIVCIILLLYNYFTSEPAIVRPAIIEKHYVYGDKTDWLINNATN